MSAKRLKFKTDRDKKRSKSFERDSQSERYWREKKMGNDEMEKKDPGLQGNEKMEAAIAGLQQEPTQEMLAHTLTVIRRRMKENGQLIIAVEPPKVMVRFSFRQFRLRMEKNGGQRLPVLRKS